VNFFLATAEEEGWLGSWWCGDNIYTFFTVGRVSSAVRVWRLVWKATWMARRTIQFCGGGRQ